MGSFLNIILGNSKSLWNAVNVAKNVDCKKIPPKMRDGDYDIAPENLSDEFAIILNRK